MDTGTCRLCNDPKPIAEAGTVHNRCRKLFQRFSLTVHQYDEILTRQNGVCALCGDVCSSGRRLAVDHDRRCCPGRTSCGKCVRGLLCGTCNRGLGMLESRGVEMHTVAWYIDPLGMGAGEIVPRSPLPGMVRDRDQ